ncbi:unnamed protein product [Bursaphelenchus okinawaensis]|uniref:Exostosin GT47 domain-containing protein n=1 Tax=Bursaphelenchus okinawaensis TaxID=465554 RepID=A0A811LE60_9BILA|nr:unnamed protein product [Bursaphelenchus okinawaensis]CAG9120907.1 unnamed protein product [Bursaphelenchus okinawaensis]
MTIDFGDECLPSPTPSTSSPVHLWPSKSKRKYNVNKTPLGIPVLCWVLLSIGLGLVILGTAGIYLIGLSSGPRVLYLKSGLEEPVDFVQCSYGQCTEFQNCRYRLGEKIKAYVQPLVELVDADGAAVAAVSAEFLALRRAFSNHVELVDSAEKACLTVPGVDFTNLMKFRSGNVVQRAIEAVERDLNGARTNILLFNNIGMIEKMQYKVIWASAELTAKQFRSHYDIAVPPLRPYNLLSADGLQNQLFTKREEIIWTVYTRFADQKVFAEMEKIMNLYEPNADRIVYGVDLPGDKFNVTHILDQKSNEVFEYSKLLKASTFTIISDDVPGYQLAIVDALQSQSIPVVISDEYVYPFGSELEWKRFSIKVPRQQANNLVIILNKFDQTAIKEMRSLARVVYDEFMGSPEKVVQATLASIKRRFSNDIYGGMDRLGEGTQGVKIFKGIPIRSMAKSVDIILPIENANDSHTLQDKIRNIYEVVGQKVESIAVFWPDDLKVEKPTLLSEHVHILSTDRRYFNKNPDEAVRTLSKKSDVTSDCWVVWSYERKFNMSQALFDQVFTVWKENADQIVIAQSSESERYNVPTGLTLVHPNLLVEMIKTNFSTDKAPCTEHIVQTTSCAMSDGACEKAPVRLCRTKDH